MHPAIEGMQLLLAAFAFKTLFKNKVPTLSAMMVVKLD